MAETDDQTDENARMLAHALDVLSSHHAHPEDRRAARHLVSILVRDLDQGDDSATEHAGA